MSAFGETVFVLSARVEGHEGEFEVVGVFTKKESVDLKILQLTGCEFRVKKTMVDYPHVNFKD